MIMLFRQNNSDCLCWDISKTKLINVWGGFSVVKAKARSDASLSSDTR